MKTGLIFALILLTCCDKRPPAPTASENQQLNDAEKMLDEMARNENANAR